MVHVEIKIPAVHIILADELSIVGLVHRRLKALALTNEFATHIDVTSVRSHGKTGNQAALDQQVRVVAHDLAILASAGLGFVRIDNEVMGPPVRFLRHERPLQAGRKSGAAASTETRSFHLLDDRITAFFQNLFGVIPGALGARAFEAPVVLAVKISEDAVLVSEHAHAFSFSVVAPPIGADSCLSICGPGFTFLPAARLSRILPKLWAVRSS